MGLQVPFGAVQGQDLAAGLGHGGDAPALADDADRRHGIARRAGGDDAVDDRQPNIHGLAQGQGPGLLGGVVAGQALHVTQIRQGLAPGGGDLGGEAPVAGEHIAALGGFGVGEVLQQVGDAGAHLVGVAHPAGGVIVPEEGAAQGREGQEQGADRAGQQAEGAFAGALAAGAVCVRSSLRHPAPIPL